MKLQVFHRTRYDYGAPVRDSFNEARLKPATSGGQVCLDFRLSVLPAARVSQYTDFQSNVVHAFDVTEPHPALMVEATSVVSTSPAPAIPEVAAKASLRAIDALTRNENWHDFLHPSRYVDLTLEARQLGRGIAAGIDGVWDAAFAVMQFIHREYEYAPATTHVHTHMREAMQLRRGVCQDFAHVLIGICRTINIPARYVSGYLYNGPADQLRGAQATHAWAEVYLPGVGWHGLDPTNGREPDERYVKLAVGRDYSDVSPLRGTYRGTSQRKMTVDVLVTNLVAQDGTAEVRRG